MRLLCLHWNRRDVLLWSQGVRVWREAVALWEVDIWQKQEAPGVQGVDEKAVRMKTVVSMAGSTGWDKRGFRASEGESSVLVWLWRGI